MDEELSYFKQHLDFLKALKNSSAEKLQKKLRFILPQQLKFLVECALNIKKGVIPLESSGLKKAVSHRAAYQELLKKSNSLKFKKELLLDNPKFVRHLASICVDSFDQNE